MYLSRWGNSLTLTVRESPSAHTCLSFVAHTGTVIVSTPQDVALTDVRRGIAAFQKLSVPVCSLLLHYFFS